MRPDFKLGIIAGGGNLPRQLIAQCVTNATPFHILAIRGQTAPADIAQHPHSWVRLGAGAQILRALKTATVTDVVMIGYVKRPSFLMLWPDWVTLKLLSKFFLGDDGLLRGIVQRFEASGFKVRGVQEFLPNLLAPIGQLGVVPAPAAALTDVNFGVQAALTHGAADIGQAVVVQGGRVLAREGRAGTNALLKKNGQAPGAILVKCCKPQQDQRVDLPTIGVATVRYAAAAGLAGIVVSAGTTLIDDLPATRAAADAAGIFLLGVEV